LFGELAAGAVHPIFFAPDVQMIPLHTQALPPSTHTNTLLAGSGPTYLIDPGPVDADEQQRLFDVLDAHYRSGRSVTAIVLTHHQPAHIVAGAACARRAGWRVGAPPLTATALAGKVEVTHFLHDGARLDLGERPDGYGRWHLEALHTPGHAAGHLAFYEPH